MMVAPFSEQDFMIPKSATGPVTWTAISDFGAQTLSASRLFNHTMLVSYVVISTLQAGSEWDRIGAARHDPACGCR
jgi:hypothetical protein